MHSYLRLNFSDVIDNVTERRSIT